MSPLVKYFSATWLVRGLFENSQGPLSWPWDIPINGYVNGTINNQRWIFNCQLIDSPGSILLMIRLTLWGYNVQYKHYEAIEIWQFQ